MNARDALTFATVAAYLLGGAMGWAICLAARKSRRYYPALALTGIGMGLLPTYSALIFVLRQRGIIERSADGWQLLTICLVCTAVVVLGLASFGYIMVEVRREHPPPVASAEILDAQVEAARAATKHEVGE